MGLWGLSQASVWGPQAQLVESKFLWAKRVRWGVRQMPAEAQEMFVEQTSEKTDKLVNRKLRLQNKIMISKKEFSLFHKLGVWD